MKGDERGAKGRGEREKKTLTQKKTIKSSRECVFVLLLVLALDFAQANAA